MDEFTYDYDRDSNPMDRANGVNPDFGELYHANGAGSGYDGLNRLTAFERGRLSDSNGDGVPDTVASPSHSQSWALDAVGDWSGVTTDGTTQSRTANLQNEVATINGQATPAYDHDGNLTTDQTGRSLTYDAWARLVSVSSGGAPLAGYGSDAEASKLDSVMGERRKRSTQVDTTAWTRVLGSLPIRIDDETNTRAWAETLTLARTHNLGAYDAAYLELALRLAVPLATLDDRLKVAAAAVGVTLYRPR